MEKLNEQLYFDPFAEEGEQLYDPIQAFSAMEQHYLEGRVEHNYAADEFVAQTEAAMLDAVFLERFDAAQVIASRMHQLCGEDHGLNQAAQRSEVFSSLMETHGSDDGNAPQKGDLKKDDEYEIDPKTGKKKKRRSRIVWFSLKP